ncbi:EF-hand domain-containing protein [Sulfurospirillum oryzae]|uniref:EF-hand domain-containing protein n=1 Tax=Sulfurospirillum oryzae TaxID=2976535 RepID=UPI0021E6DC0C|nr:EF-hand domain-containing protein [Sulfurospirillum oryzae]
MKKALMLLAMVSLVGLNLFAADATRGPVAFETYDKNKDGVITQEEFDAVKAERMSAKAEAGMPMRNAANSPDFTFFDTNKDGKITKEEYRDGQLSRMRSR